MPASITIGSEVSSVSSKFAHYLDLEPGGRRRKRARIHGIVLTTASDGKWVVRWCQSGEIEKMSTSVLRKDGDPCDDTMHLVHNFMVSRDEFYAARGNLSRGVTSSRDGTEPSLPTFTTQVTQTTASESATETLAIVPHSNFPPVDPPETAAPETALVDINIETEETDPDIQEEEDESVPLGSGFVYDDETLNELMNDVLGTRRVEVGLTKASMLGETVNENGQVWKVRGDIKK